MIIVGLGANLPTARFGPPPATLAAALDAFDAAGVRVEARSRWYRSKPVPPSDQPWFVNGVAALQTDLGPSQLLQLLHHIEADFGRIRRVRDEPRAIDLDLISYNDRVSGPGETPVLPHPRMAERAFVLLPLAELDPSWRHPRLGKTVSELVRLLPSEQVAEPIGEMQSE